MKAETIIWVEKLGALDLALLFIESLLTGAEIRYDEHQVGPGARRLLPLAGPRFLPAGLRYDEKLPGGEAPHYERLRRLKLYLDSFCAEHLAGKPSWLVNTARCYTSLYLAPRVAFMMMAELAAKRRGASSNVLYLYRHPANRLILSAYREPGFSLRQSLSLRGLLRCLMAPRALLLGSLLARAKSQKGLSNLKAVRPSVWVEYEPMELSGYLGLSFWRERVDFKDFDFVFYIDRLDSPLSPEAVRPIEGKGLNWIDCHDPARWAQLSARDYFSLLGWVIVATFRRPLWLNHFEAEHEIYRRLWASVLKRFKVKLLIQHQETSWKQTAQAQAVEDAGGIMLGSHWSYVHSDGAPTHLHPQHLYFVWGKTTSDWLEAKGHDIGHILPCGVWLRADGDVSSHARSLAAGIRFKLAIFDSSFSYDLFLSEELSKFLDAVLGLLEQHKDWGALLKPKDRTDYAGLPHGAALEARISKLKAQGRLAVLDRAVSPIAAARAADLSVCFNLNSAGIVAGVFGGKAIHWDANGWTRHPFYKHAGQKVLYPSLDEFRSAVLAAAGGDSSVGDFSLFRQSVNHFDDDKAVDRVAGFIQSYLKSVQQGELGVVSLQKSVTDYQNRFLPDPTSTRSSAS